MSEPSWEGGPGELTSLMEESLRRALLGWFQAQTLAFLGRNGRSAALSTRWPSSAASRSPWLPRRRHHAPPPARSPGGF